MTELNIENSSRKADVVTGPAQFDLRDLMQLPISSIQVDKSTAQYLPNLEFTGSLAQRNDGLQARPEETKRQRADEGIRFTGAIDDRTLINQKLDPTGIAVVEKIALDSLTSGEDRLRSLQVLQKNGISQFSKDGEEFQIRNLSSDVLSLIKNNDPKQEVWHGDIKLLSRDLQEKVLPTDRKETRPEQQSNDKPKSKEEKLFDSHTSPEEKIKLAQELYKEGKSIVKGPDGKTYQINVQRVGDRDVVGIMGQDAQGHSRPILRGIVEKDGHVSKQRDSKGNEVDYPSDWAKKNIPDNGLVKYEPRQEKPEKPEQPPEKQEKPDLEKSRARLQESAEKITDPKARAEFLKDMETFEKRAKEQGLPPEEVAKTMDQTRRLLDAKEGAASPENRILAARGLAHHLANPSDTDQGHHSTCGPTSLGERTLTRNPSRAAEIVATTAIEGQWTAPDGRKIKIPAGNLTPGREEATFPPTNGERSYAMQLMNAAMINDMSQRRMPPEYYVQGRVEGEGDTGERLYYEGEDPQKGRKYNGHTGPELASEGNRLNGDRNFVLEDPATSTGDNVVAIRSEQDLKNALEQAQKTGNLPLIVFLDSNDPMFGGDGKGPHAFHFVSITGYDPATGKVKVSNQWGKQNDKEVPISDLYRAIKRR